MANLVTIGVTVNADGSIQSGPYGSDSVLVNKTAQGTYLVTFNNVFSQPPVCSVTQIFNGDMNYGGGSTRDNAVIVAINQNQCKLTTGDGDGDRQDRKFSFLAFGPARQ